MSTNDLEHTIVHELFHLFRFVFYLSSRKLSGGSRYLIIVPERIGASCVCETNSHGSFHIITRNNPEFRKEMYAILNKTGFPNQEIINKISKKLQN